MMFCEFHELLLWNMEERIYGTNGELGFPITVFLLYESIVAQVKTREKEGITALPDRSLSFFSLNNNKYVLYTLSARWPLQKSTMSLTSPRLSGNLFGRFSYNTLSCDYFSFFLSCKELLHIAIKNHTYFLSNSFQSI